MFTTTALTGEQVLVSGTDVRGTTDSTIVDGSQWAQLQRDRALSQAHNEFDAKVEAFFAPVVEAAEQVRAAHTVTLDPLMYIVEQEGAPGTPERSEKLTTLEPGSVILRAIAEGLTDRLLWVKGELLVTAAPIANERADLYSFPEEEVADEPFGESPAL